ncbi:MAG: CaiB/BaiF CoA-transferase family protein [Pseudomonadota bacterium]
MHDALRGVRVIDLSVNAPGPYASKMLLDMGATVTVVVNPAGPPLYTGALYDPMLSARGGDQDPLGRGKARVALDLKSDEGRAALLGHVAKSDVLISEMRPGKLDRLGLDWATLSATNPRLILCQITGYGDRGAMAQAAGHDINYVAMSGALSLLRQTDGRPAPPQNILADYAGGGMIAVTAILGALLERARTGQGQNMIVSMTDGVRYLVTDIAAATVLAGQPEAAWRGTLSGGMPTYGCYQTLDGKWIALGALEPKFVDAIAEVLGWPELATLMKSKENWAAARAGLAERIASRTRDDWIAAFDGTDACVTPVRSLDETAPDGLATLRDVVRIAASGQ